MTKELYQTIRDAIAYAAEDRGRTYDAAHEAHYMALHVIEALARSGYTITKDRVAA